MRFGGLCRTKSSSAAHHSTCEASPKLERVLREPFGFRNTLVIEADRARAAWRRSHRERAEERVQVLDDVGRAINRRRFWCFGAGRPLVDVHGFERQLVLELDEVVHVEQGTVSFLSDDGER